MIFLICLLFYISRGYAMELNSEIKAKTPPSLKALTIQYIINNKDFKYSSKKLPLDLETTIQSYKTPSLWPEECLRLAAELNNREKIDICTKLIANKLEKKLTNKFESDYIVPKNECGYLKAYKNFLDLEQQESKELILESVRTRLERNRKIALCVAATIGTAIVIPFMGGVIYLAVFAFRM